MFNCTSYNFLQLTDSLTNTRLITHDIDKHSSKLFFFFSNLTTSTMTNHISTTELSEFIEQSAEPLPATDPSVITITSPAPDDNTNKLHPEESLQIETSSPRAQGNNEKLSHYLLTARNFIQRIITLSQEFLTSLNEKGDTNTSPHIMKQNIIRRTHSNTKESLYHHLLHDIYTAINTVAKQHQFQKHDKTSQNYHLQSTETLPQSLPQQIQNLQQQVNKLHRLRTNHEEPPRNFHHQPETRTCFRCAKYGHVAKFCRSNLLLQTQKTPQTNQRTHLFKKQMLIRQRPSKQLQPMRHKFSVRDPLHNRQSLTLHKKTKSFSARKTKTSTPLNLSSKNQVRQ